MGRLFLSAVPIVVLALVACGDAEPPSATPTPTPAATATPLPLPLPLALREGPIARDGAFVVEVASGKVWWLGDRGGLWSPDGRTLLVTGCCIGTGGLDLIDVPAGPAARIYDGDVDAAAWSPDGSRIAFRPVADRGLHVINTDGSGLRLVGEVAGWRMSWSAQGDDIALESGEIVYLVDPSTEGQQELGRFYDFQWSPDGRRLVLSGESGLYVLDVSTAERRQLAPGPAYGRVLWSPDGSRLVLPYGERVTPRFGPYAGTPEAGAPLHHIFSADGSGEPVSLPPSRFPAWSPDGMKLAFESEGCVTGEWDLYLVDAAGGQPQRLTNTPDAFKEGPEWSPDGSSIALATYDELTLLDLSTGESSRLAFAEGGEGFHLHGLTWQGSSAWSPDGRFLQFSAGGGHGICD